jgi:hypothetical protein
MRGLYKKIYGKFAQTQSRKGEEGTELALIQQELKIPKLELFRTSTSGKCQNCDFSEVNSSQ